MTNLKIIKTFSPKENEFKTDKNFKNRISDFLIQKYKADKKEEIYAAIENVLQYNSAICVINNNIFSLQTRPDISDIFLCKLI